MAPIKVFSTIIRIFISQPLEWLSFNFTDPKYKITLLTIVSCLYAVLFSIFSVTTCFETRDSTRCAQSLVMGFVGAQVKYVLLIVKSKIYKKFYIFFQCASKAFFVALYHKGLYATLKFMSELYKANERHVVNNNDLRKVARYCDMMAKVFGLCILGTGCILILGPIPIYAFTGDIMPILPVKIPFISTDTIFGYIIHVIYHLFGLNNALFGLLAVDVFNITAMAHIWPMTTILERSITHVNGSARCLNREEFTNSLWLRLRLRNIGLLHREMFL